uniref:Uncharacterized protein n=1 Tax=Amphimedon queenslandica TaxID=400682 RepID=A0A1X7UMD4_AMPQE
MIKTFSLKSVKGYLSGTR